MRFLFSIGCVAGVVVLIGGCESTPSDAGFSDVQRLSGSRINQPIYVHRTSADDQAAQQLTNQLLARELSADDAIRIALLNNHSLQAAYAQLGIAQADVVQAGLLTNPVLFVSPRYPDHAPHGPDVEISLEEDFVDLLLMPARKKIAAAKFEQTKLEVSQDVFELASQVKSAYYRLVGDEQMFQMRRTAVDAMQLSADAAQKMYEAGNLNELDLATQQASAVQALADLQSAEARVNDDRQKLIELLGIDDAPQIRVAAKLPDPVPDPDLDTLLKLARSRRLDLLAARQQVAVAAKEARVANVSSWIASLDLGIDTERSPDGNRITGPMAMLPIPLLDQGQAIRMQSNARLRQASEGYQALAIRIGSEVRQAAAKMAWAHQRAELYRTKIIPLRQRIVAQAQLHYNGMLLGIFQLLQAKQNEIDAGREYILSLRDYWIARCELERAVGREIVALPATQPTSKPTIGE